MRVIYYIHNLAVGGAEVIVTRSLLKLKEKGINVFLVENVRQDSFLTRQVEDAGIPIFNLLPANNSKNLIQRRINSLYYYHFANYKKLWKPILQKINADLIHVNTSPRLMKGIDFPSDRIVYTFHCDVERGLESYGNSCKKYLETLSKEGMTFFSLSDSMSADIHREFNTDKIAYVPNGIEIERIESDRYNREEFLASIGIDTEAFIVGQVGRLDPVKNYEKTICVFREILKYRPESFLLIVGRKSTEYYYKIQKLANVEGISDHIKFLGERDDATKIMSVFDVLLHPSHSESFSLVLVEAQVLGIRCITSTVVPKDVICNNNCFALDISAPDQEWARLAIEKTVKGNSKSLNKFDIETISESIVENYLQIMK